MNKEIDRKIIEVFSRFGLNCAWEIRQALADALPTNEKMRVALSIARDFIDPDCSPSPYTNREMVAKIDAALSERAEIGK